MAAAKPHVVFHLASLFLASHQPSDVQRLVESNLLFGAQLAQAAADNDVRHFINTGTAWQYFHSETYEPVCLYAATKEAFEKLLHFYVSIGKLQVINLHLFDTYGPDDPRPKLFKALDEAARLGKTLQMSPGDQQLDFTHIDDVVDAFALSAERLLSGATNGSERFGVCTNERHTLRQIVEIYAEAAGATLNATWGGRPYREREVMELWNAPTLPGWKPRISFRQGVAALIKDREPSPQGA